MLVGVTIDTRQVAFIRVGLCSGSHSVFDYIEMTIISQSI